MEVVVTNIRYLGSNINIMNIFIGPIYENIEDYLKIQSPNVEFSYYDCTKFLIKNRHHIKNILQNTPQKNSFIAVQATLEEITTKERCNLIDIYIVLDESLRGNILKDIQNKFPNYSIVDFTLLDCTKFLVENKDLVTKILEEDK